MLLDFVLEPDVFIYFVATRGLQYIGFDQQNNGSIIEAQISSLDAFGDTVLIISDSYLQVCNATVGTCQSNVSLYTGGQPITDVLTFRKSKQPLPGTVVMYMYCHSVSSCFASTHMYMYIMEYDGAK